MTILLPLLCVHLPLPATSPERESPPGSGEKPGFLPTPSAESAETVPRAQRDEVPFWDSGHGLAPSWHGVGAGGPGRQTPTVRRARRQAPAMHLPSLGSRTHPLGGILTPFALQTWQS